MKRLLAVVLLFAFGCDAELVPLQNDSVGQNAPVKEVASEPEAETATASPKLPKRKFELTIGDDGTITKTYLDDSPLVHGKAIGSSWRGKVVAITDGDTIKVLNDQNEQVKVRLESIDTPERKQPFGEVAKDYLGQLIHEKNVIVKETGEDRYGRTLAFIALPIGDGSLDINREMVRSGHAWHYVTYSKSETLGFEEQEARKEKCGLWAGTGPDDQVPPWEWRKRGRK